MTAPEAEKYLANTELVGYRDWHLPGMKELSTLIQPSAVPTKFIQHVGTVVNDMPAADAWIFATPIYNGHMSSRMSALLITTRMKEWSNTNIAAF